MANGIIQFIQHPMHKLFVDYSLHNSWIRLFDKVKINNQTRFIYGWRQSGSYLVKDIDGNIISSNISYKKLNLIEKRKGWIVDFKQS